MAVISTGQLVINSEAGDDLKETLGKSYWLTFQPSPYDPHRTFLRWSEALLGVVLYLCIGPKNDL